MFRRRTSSSGKIHYRINIDKSMCPKYNNCSAIIISCEEDVVPKGGKPPFIPPGLPIGASAGYFLWHITIID